MAIGAQGIDGDYGPTSHLPERLLWKGYRGLEAAEPEPVMSDLEIRQRHVAAATIEAEERAAMTGRRRFAVVR
jgi:hypothetical protein